VAQRRLVDDRQLDEAALGLGASVELAAIRKRAKTKVMTEACASFEGTAGGALCAWASPRQVRYCHQH
jgi:hypothetical protein